MGEPLNLGDPELCQEIGMKQTHFRFPERERYRVSELILETVSK